MAKRFSIFLLSFVMLFYCFSPEAILHARVRNGLDVSEWQGKINWRKVSDAGIHYVYIRACIGSRYTDSQFRRNHRRAKEQGIKTGFYHYVTARTVSQARRQARFFAKTIKPYRYDIKPAMDFESFGRLSKREINRIALAYLRELQKQTSYKPVIYSDSNNAVHTFTDRRLRKYPLWVAAYGVRTPPTGQWDTYAGWQYADNGRISGINGNSVDFNHFRKKLLLKGNR